MRPLVEDEAARRDVRLDPDRAGAPLMSVFGGKITAGRKLAGQAVDRVGHTPAIQHQAGRRKLACRAAAPSVRCPASAAYSNSTSGARRARRYPWLLAPLQARYTRACGTRIHALPACKSSLAGLVLGVPPGLHEAEIDDPMACEWARRSAGILWRRTRLGLHEAPGSAALPGEWIGARGGTGAVVSRGQRRQVRLSGTHGAVRRLRL